MRIKISCLHILLKKGQFRVSFSKYYYLGIWAEMQVNHQAPNYKTGPVRARRLASHGSEGPHTGHCRSSYVPCLGHQLLHELHRIRASTFVVGVITKKFHKVLVNICVQVAYPWKWRGNTYWEQWKQIINQRWHPLDQLGVSMRLYGPPEGLDRLRTTGPRTTNHGTHLLVTQRSLKAVHATWRSAKYHGRPTYH